MNDSEPTAEVPTVPKGWDKVDTSVEPAKERPDYEVAKDLLTARLRELGIHAECEFDREEPLKGGFLRHHWYFKLLIGGKFSERPGMDSPGRNGFVDPWMYAGGKEILSGPYFCGAHHKAGSPAFKKRRIKPTTADILSCLCLDSSAIDYPSYEDWAKEFGYAEDSRAGEKIYRACLATGLKLRAVLGDAVLTELRELSARL